MFLPLLFVCLIHLVVSLNDSKDLSIKQYYPIGCLKLKSNKQFIVNHIQKNILSPYQTFSSSNMTIELCFRLCRQWIILLYDNQKNCICLYTINKSYEYLGKFLSNTTCTSNHAEIYSLTKTTSIFSSSITSQNVDISFDGCYYVHPIQIVNKWLNHDNDTQRIDLCRQHCQNTSSFFLARKGACYCSPLQISETISKTLGIRKPLKHCSFNLDICKGFSNSCEQYYLKTNPDNLIKIDMQHNISYEEEFNQQQQIIINNEIENFNDNILSCPLEFILFNKICYYIDLSLVYDNQMANKSCYNKNSNSTLVELDIPQQENIDITNYRGRMYDDVLLEFFYYSLENGSFEPIDKTLSKNYSSPLLVRYKSDINKCILRYFNHSSGGFRIHYGCHRGGYPVCQCQPNQIKIESTTSIILFNSSELSTTTTVLNYENFTTISNDQDRGNNVTEINNNTSTKSENASSESKSSAYRTLLIILSGPGLALIILIVGVAVLIRYLRQGRYPSSTGSSVVGSHRRQRSSTVLTLSDISNTPAVPNSCLKKPPRSFPPESQRLLGCDNYVTFNSETIDFVPTTRPQILNNYVSFNEDIIELLPTRKPQQISNDEENLIYENNDESYYATLN